MTVEANEPVTHARTLAAAREVRETRHEAYIVDHLALDEQQLGSELRLVELLADQLRDVLHDRLSTRDLLIVLVLLERIDHHAL